MTLRELVLDRLNANVDFAIFEIVNCSVFVWHILNICSCI
jgi:hypothetical protein